MNKTIVICGPTSTGKTSLAINLCKAFNGEIISADSRQIYKYMDIGTGKLPVDRPNPQIERFDGLWKISKIPIYMYDVVSPAKTYSVYDYSKKAKNELTSIQKRQKIPFIVGGTGFYIDVLTGRKSVANVPPNFALRTELEKNSLEDLQRTLKNLNEEEYKRVDLKNRARLVRSIEILKSKKSFFAVPPPNEEEVKVLLIGLTAPRTYLYEKADLWVEKIVGKGLILETKTLLDMGFSETIPMKGLVYSSAVEYLDEKITMEEMKQKIKWDIHGYIRRQLTWFNRNPEIMWFNIAKKGFDIEVLKTVQLFLYGH
ncbi:tRNA (adenosine(37)-N6)-dimethylallyltransferase MiaA [Patescibacteria group bacterium]|nr:tRNA (adenosine(37)-N6)-dimethylallyltransferase MiaA [Patescibacteria group bacterium]